jgi:hypothetical protein
MTCDEKSGQYSLIECIRLTKSKYASARPIAEALRKWFARTRKQQLTFVPNESLVTWKQSAEILKAIMFQGAASFSVEVGIKATANLAVPSRTEGAV